MEGNNTYSRQGFWQESSTDENMGTRAYSNTMMQKINAMGNFVNCAHWSNKMEKIQAAQTSKKPQEEWRKCDNLVCK